MADEKSRRRKEREDEGPDVEAHGYVAEEPAEDDPERKRKRRQSEKAEAEEAGRRRR